MTSSSRLISLVPLALLFGCTPTMSEPSGGSSAGTGGATAPSGTGGTPSAGTGGAGGGSTSAGGAPANTSTGGTPASTGTGGSSAAGTGGSSAAGTGGATSTPPADAATPATDTASTPTPPSDGKTFECSLVIGIAATGQWFNAGFERVVDNAKWELLAVHSGFVNTWADPNSDFWTKAPASACTSNAKTPDRVILTALYSHWMEATVDQWVDVLKKTVETFKAKNPNLKRLELATFVRGPGGKPCQASMTFKSVILPAQDEAYVKIAAMYPDLVTVAPKFEVRTCADFGGNPPHFSGAGAQAAATTIGNHYK